MRRKRVGILTGGGDTPPLNAVIFGLRDLLSTHCEVIGFVKGWQGVLERDYVHLNSIESYGHVGGTFLKSSRVNLAVIRDGFQRANHNLADLDYLVVIGGDDTLSNIYGIESCICFAVSKTIDNDVGRCSIEKDGIAVENYFTLGYPTAANKIVSYVSWQEGVRTTAYSHERIVIVESMGMHAGWLALAADFGGPDFIIIPEFPLNYDAFVEKLKEQYFRDKNSVLVVAEGSKLANGVYLKEDSSETDDFGHARFGGSSFVLRDMLKKDLAGFMNVRNINAVNPSYLYRCGRPNKLEEETAQAVAQLIGELVLQNAIQEHQFVSVEYENGKFYAKNQPLASFAKTNDGRFPKRYVGEAFYDREKNRATREWREYLQPMLANAGNAGRDYRYI